MVWIKVRNGKRKQFNPLIATIFLTAFLIIELHWYPTRITFLNIKFHSFHELTNHSNNVPGWFEFIPQQFSAGG